MEKPKPFVITIVGPESSGKTTLARELADRYGFLWVPEYAREYLDGLGRDYQVEDLVLIAKGQLGLINRQLAVSCDQFAVVSQELSANSPYSTSLDFGHLKQDIGASMLSFKHEEIGHTERPVLIVDSGMLSLRVWARIKYGITIPIVEEALAKDITSMYILCRPVYPWEPDPMREAPSVLDRAWIYNQYLKELVMIPAK